MKILHIFRVSMVTAIGLLLLVQGTTSALVVRPVSQGSAGVNTVVSGAITTDTTWTLVDSPYTVTGSILVMEGVTLTIEPGVIVKFEPGLAIRVDGQLIAQGTEEEPIIFTSDQPEPAPGDWGYIQFTDSSVDAIYDQTWLFTGSTYYGGGHCSNVSADLNIDVTTVESWDQTGCYHNSDVLAVAHLATIPASTHTVRFNEAVGDASVYSHSFMGFPVAEWLTGSPNSDIPIVNDEETTWVFIGSVHYGGGHCSNIAAELSIDGSPVESWGQTGCYHNSDVLTAVHLATIPAGTHTVRFNRTVGDASVYNESFIGIPVPESFTGSPNSDIPIVTDEETTWIFIGSVYYGGGDCSSVSAELNIDGSPIESWGQTGCYHNSDVLTAARLVTIPAGTHTVRFNRTVGDASVYNDSFIGIPVSEWFTASPNQDIPITVDKETNYTSGSILEHCIVEYGGGGENVYGAIMIEDSSPFINYCTIHNSAANGIRADGSLGLVIANCTVDDNEDNGIYVAMGCTVSIYNCVVSNSHAGIYVSGNTTIATISDCIIADNDGSAGLAAITIRESNVTIERCEILRTRGTSNNGDGIYNYGGTIVCNNCTIADNNNDGWNIWLGTLTISECIVTGNNGHGLSGAANTHIFVHRCIVSDNGKKGISVKGNVHISECIVADNNGGGIFFNGDRPGYPVNITGNTIVNNMAATPDDTAGVYIDSTYEAGLFANNNIIGNEAVMGTAVTVKGKPLINNNNLVNNTLYEVTNITAQGSPDINAENNWWGTSSDAVIQEKIYDWFDDGSVGIVDYIPFLTEPSPEVPPSPPTGFAAIPDPPNIDLSWNPNPEADITGYKVYYDANSGFPYVGTGANEGDSPIDVGNVTEFTLSGLGSTYYLAITAYDADGNESWYSIEETVTLSGSISGYVYQSDGTTPIEGAEVIVRLVGDLEIQGTAETDNSGYYVVSGLSTGEYTVKARAPEQGYACEWYQDAHYFDDATPVPVTAPSNTSDINFTLDPGGTISGQVTYAGDGSPIENVLVYAIDVTNSQVAASDFTDAQGLYMLGLPAGSYKVAAYPAYTGLNYAGEWYDDVHSSSLATPVPVTVSQNTSGIDFALEEGGSISGYVYESDGTTPIPSLVVYAIDVTNNLLTASSSTDAEGHYTLVLPTGSYKVRAYPSYTGLNYVNEWYDDVYNQNEATAVSVTAPDDTPNINFILDIGGTISGYVYQSDGVTPIPNLNVYAINATTDQWTAGANTDAEGHYTLLLPTGSYKVRACASCSGLNYIDEWYDDVYDQNQATPVPVTAPDDTPGINFSLETAEVAVTVDAPDIVPEDYDFTVTIDITEVTDLNGAQYDITFDPTVLRLDDVTDGQIDSTDFGVEGFTEIAPGTYRILNSMGLGSVSGSGYMAVLHFHSVGSLGDSTTIEISNGILSGMAGEIPANWFGDFVEISILPGDANGDGVINVLDMTAVALCILGIGPCNPGADCNQDGTVNVLDMTCIARIILGLD